ncbi:unnamed protein product [Schistosoma rodhaini]|nr:unnamed protein product [Schistosoma rodhaini]
MQICSSKVNGFEENIQSISSYEGSNLPINVPDIDYNKSKISVIQSHTEESWIQNQPLTAKINQKSLADELFEMEADQDVHSILLTYGTEHINSCAHYRKMFTFENKTVEEFLRDLSIRLHTFKLKLRCKRNMLQQHGYYLLDYEQIHEGKRYWSAEDVNDFKCESETYFGLIIKQCAEISVLTGMHFQKAPTFWTNVPSNVGERFLTTFINQSTSETRSCSTHDAFFSGWFGKKGKDTTNGTVKHEKKGIDDWSLVPVITGRSQLTRINDINANQENEAPINNKLLETVPAPIEQLTYILDADHKTLLCGINMRQLKKTHIEFPLSREILKLREISATQIFLPIGELTQYRDPKPMRRSLGNIHEKTFSDTNDGSRYFFKESNSQNETKSVSQYSYMEMNLKFRDPFDQKSKRGTQMLVKTTIFMFLFHPCCVYRRHMFRIITRLLFYT